MAVTGARPDGAVGPSGPRPRRLRAPPAACPACPDAGGEGRVGTGSRRAADDPVAGRHLRAGAVGAVAGQPAASPLAASAADPGVRSHHLSDAPAGRHRLRVHHSPVPGSARAASRRDPDRADHGAGASARSAGTDPRGVARLPGPSGRRARRPAGPGAGTRDRSSTTATSRWSITESTSRPPSRSVRSSAGAWWSRQAWRIRACASSSSSPARAPGVERDRPPTAEQRDPGGGARAADRAQRAPRDGAAPDAGGPGVVCQPPSWWPGCWRPRSRVRWPG